MSRTCDGSGYCLLQTWGDDGYEYYKDPDCICEHNCEPKLCPNYVLCKVKAPQCIFYCHASMCTNCNITFGTWMGGKGIPLKSEIDECPICFDQHVQGISQPFCDHMICIKCFNRCYYGDDDENEPQFPYSSEIEDEYYDDRENPKWEIDYPLIKEYNEAWDHWDEAKSEKRCNEEYLKRCPICRK